MSQQQEGSGQAVRQTILSSRWPAETLSLPRFPVLPAAGRFPAACLSDTLPASCRWILLEHCTVHYQVFQACVDGDHRFGNHSPVDEMLLKDRLYPVSIYTFIVQSNT